MWDEIIKEYNKMSDRITESTLTDIQWEKANKLKKEKSFRINILSAFDKEPLEDVYVGLEIYDNIRDRYYIAHYLWIHYTQGWTYLERTVDKDLYPRKSQHYSLYPDENKPIQYYKKWGNFKRRLIKDFGTNLNVVPILKQEWIDPWKVKRINQCIG